ncbi:host-nuclease inhibitor Gam family protein [Clostridium sp.]|uniref:host-nuclease inhibitor Gam family protein n=1 Tax=Clostridium sp. TaxID=1506 RepID=UPI001A4CDEA3|nr:host-nuclease inhibitor Gam family protein [Clostridium sp.]MBK5236761.1 host-nuclease inhibitor Gam family protein [Clostridium sp.]
MTPYDIDLAVERELRGITELQADELITSIKDFQTEKERFQTIANGKIENIQSTLEIQTNHIDNEIQFEKDQLRAFFNTVKSKETKTQRSYAMLSGKLIYKKASQKIKHDAEKLETYLSNNADEYLKEVITNKIDWAEFKKNLVIDNGMIINTHTGQILDAVCGLSLEETKESFDIK